MPAAPNRSVTLLSTPQVIGLMKPSGGGGEYAELIFRICATSVGSLGIQLPMTIRPPGRVTRAISLATSNGRGANIAPKMLTVKSKESSPRSSRFEASPSWNWTLLSPSASARRFPAATRLHAMSTASTLAPSLAAGSAVVPSPDPRSRTSSSSVMPSLPTSASPLSRMLSAICVKSPFSHNALFGFILDLPRRPPRVNARTLLECAATSIVCGPADRRRPRAHRDQGSDPPDNRHRLVAASDLVHRQPPRAPVLDRNGRRRLPRAVRRRGHLRPERPGVRRPRHPHERRLPPRRRPRGTL